VRQTHASDRPTAFSALTMMVLRRCTRRIDLYKSSLAPLTAEELGNADAIRADVVKNHRRSRDKPYRRLGLEPLADGEGDRIPDLHTLVTAMSP
jgi:hypothetical protein